LLVLVIVDEDIRECATIAARMFDHIIIRQENILRGRTEEIINLILGDRLFRSRRDL
jgi:hypothetical protein